MIKALDTLEVITFFVEDLPSTIRFYRDVFGLETVYSDDVSHVLVMGDFMINLLAITEAPTLVEPAPVAPAQSGSRSLFTIKVEDADEVCAKLVEHGVRLLNGPIDRPWGRRTAAFADPAGNVWEIAQEIKG